MRAHIVAAGVLAAAVQVSAAVKAIPVQVNQPVIENGHSRMDRRKIQHPFTMTIISDLQGTKGEVYRNGSPFLEAQPGEHYTVELYNPLPVRAAVNLTVDGINSITGKPSGIADGSKWIIEPHSKIRISGWQVSQGDARRFFFTEKPKSYAAWRGENLGKNLAANCGVIGAAFFWNQKELDEYYARNPIMRDSPDAFSHKMEGERRMAASGMAESPKWDKNQDAGTGMGERYSHPTQELEFRFNRGMYKVSEALLVYYDFARLHSPNPFPAISFAPEMP